MLALTPAQKQLVTDNIPLSIHAANHRFRRFHGRLGLEDLLSAAQFGLCVAAVKYKPSKLDPTNRRWSHYAMTIMEHRMSDAIKTNGVIKLPLWIFKRDGLARLAKQEAEQYEPEKKHQGKRTRLVWLDVKRAQNILNEEGLALT